MPFFRFAIFVGLATISLASLAMDVKITSHAMVLSGEVVARDLDRIKAAFKANPGITHVVLRNSMGGNSWTGYRLGELFREKGVTTAVSGFCVSSCSRLFLGGKVRMFSDDYPASLTYVGFHGQYDFGKLNPAAIKKDDLVGWTTKFTDGKVDQKLIQRWINIERRAGDVRFYPDAVTAQFKRPTMLCQGTESVRPQQCEMITTDALAQGIVTTNAYYSSPDAADGPDAWEELARVFLDYLQVYVGDPLGKTILQLVLHPEHMVGWIADFLPAHDAEIQEVDARIDATYDEAKEGAWN